MNAESLHWLFHGAMGMALVAATGFAWTSSGAVDRIADLKQAECPKGFWCQDEKEWSKTLMDCAEDEEVARTIDWVDRDCICIGQGGELEDFCNNWCQELSAEHNECYERLARGD